MTQWIQKQTQLSARPRGCHLVTSEILHALPELHRKLGGQQAGIPTAGSRPESRAQPRRARRHSGSRSRTVVAV
ncbi:MAG: hypothetical protein ACPGXX_15085, partial [Planctomycetaceae bacterium]